MITSVLPTIDRSSPLTTSFLPKRFARDFVSRKKDVHLAKLVRRRGVIAKTTTTEDTMHPTIIKALADERIAAWTSIRPRAKRDRRLRGRRWLVWATR
jgi:hypothetical protein